MPTNYNGYTVPEPTDIADAPAAFEQFSDSIPFSEYVAIESLSADTTVVDSYNGKMIFATADLTLTFGTLTDGFSVAVTADTGVTVDYLGVDKVDQESTAYQIAAVVAVNGTNIISKSGTSYIDPNVEPEPEPEPEIDLRVPQPPVITNPEGGNIINFTPGVDGTAGETLAYGSTIEPSNDGETVVVDQDTLEVSVEGYSPFTDYVVSIYGVNVAGAGLPSFTDPFQLNYNEASGGTETVVNDYNGTGETWRTHTFLATETLEIASSPKPYSYLLVGRGGDPGTFGVNQGGAGGGGGGGGFINKTDQEIPSGSYEVVVGSNASFNGDTASPGGRGQGESNGKNGGTSGAPTSNGGGSGASAIEGGGGGGAGGVGGNGVGNGGGPGGAGLASNISGINTGYGSGGTGGKQGSGAPGYGFSGQAAGAVVAYQIGISSTSQIKNAQAAQAARSQGYDDGYGEGFTEGRSAAKTDAILTAAEKKRKAEAKKLEKKLALEAKSEELSGQTNKTDIEENK